MAWYEKLTGSLEQKKQWREAKARVEALPEPYRAAAEAVGRYSMYYGGLVAADNIVQLFLDHADLWERAAIDGTPIHDIVGEDPVAFAEEFAQAYGGRQWIDKERARLVKAIDAAEKQQIS